MLICIGLSWPVSIAKTLRTRVGVGKARSSRETSYDIGN